MFASAIIFYRPISLSFAEVLALGLTVGLTIGGVEFMGGEIAVGFSRWWWWKLLMSLQRCSTVEVGTHVLSSSG